MPLIVGQAAETNRGMTFLIFSPCSGMGSLLTPRDTRMAPYSARLQNANGESLIVCGRTPGSNSARRRAIRAPYCRSSWTVASSSASFASAPASILLFVRTIAHERGAEDVVCSHSRCVLAKQSMTALRAVEVAAERRVALEGLGQPRRCGR